MTLKIYAQVIKDALDSQNWKFSCENVAEDEISFLIKFTLEESEKIYCKIMIFESGICDIEVVLPIVCQPEQYMELCYYLTKQNFASRYATLRLDMRNGEINNSYSFDFNQSTTPESFLELFLRVRDVDDSVMEELNSICNRKTTTGKNSLNEKQAGGKHKIML